MAKSKKIKQQRLAKRRQKHNVKKKKLAKLKLNKPTNKFEVLELSDHKTAVRKSQQPRKFKSSESGIDIENRLMLQREHNIGKASDAKRHFSDYLLDKIRQGKYDLPDIFQNNFDIIDKVFDKQYQDLLEQYRGDYFNPRYARKLKEFLEDIDVASMAIEDNVLFAENANPETIELQAVYYQKRKDILHRIETRIAEALDENDPALEEINVLLASMEHEAGVKLREAGIAGWRAEKQTIQRTLNQDQQIINVIAESTIDATLRELPPETEGYLWALIRELLAQDPQYLENIYNNLADIDRAKLKEYARYYYRDQVEESAKAVLTAVYNGNIPAEILNELEIAIESDYQYMEV